MPKILLSAALSLFAACAVADDFKIIKLEQDVRNLERQVQALNRELAELRSRLSRGGEPVGGQSRSGADAKEAASTSWVSAASWDRVRTGMGELEVISALGPPTSMRTENGARVLLYALEIGSDGFLSGAVTLRDGEVLEVQRPTLK